MSELPFQVDPVLRAQWLECVSAPPSTTSPEQRLLAAGALLLAEEENECLVAFEALCQDARGVKVATMVVELEVRLAALEARLEQQDQLEELTSETSSGLAHCVLELLLARQRVHLLQQALLFTGAFDESGHTVRPTELLDQKVQAKLSLLAPAEYTSIAVLLRPRLETEIEAIHPHNRGGLWWLTRLVDVADDVQQNLTSAGPKSARPRHSRWSWLQGRTTWALAAVSLLALGSSATWVTLTQDLNSAEKEKLVLEQQLQTAQELLQEKELHLKAQLQDAESLGEAQRRVLEAKLASAEKMNAEAAKNPDAGTAPSAKNAPPKCAPDDQKCKQKLPPSYPKKAKPKAKGGCPAGDPMCGGL